MIRFTAELRETLLDFGPVMVLPAYLLPLLWLAGIRRLRTLCWVPLITVFAMLARDPFEDRFIHAFYDRLHALPYWYYWVQSEYAFDTILAATMIGALTRSAVPVFGPFFGLWLASVNSFVFYTVDPPWQRPVTFGRGVSWTQDDLRDVISYVLWHAAVVALLYVWARKRRLAAPGFVACSRCGYALTGLANPAACPECGSSFAPSVSATS